MGSYQESPFHTPQHHRKVSSASPSPSQTPRFGRERGERSEPPRVAESFSGRLFDKERGVNGQRERGEKSESRVAESLSGRFFEREREKGFFDKEKGVNVQVLLRCRPLSEDEVRAGVPQVISCNEQKREVTIVQNIANKPMDKSFTFDKVYGPKTQQRTLYEQSIFPIVNEVLEGYNCTIFAYGQTGTGKTYTMEGAGRRTKNGELPSDAGVIPRAVKQIIDTLESQNADYSMKITFLELYNEEITDLLANDDSSKNPDDKSKKSVTLLEDAKGGVQVRGLEEEVVYSANEIYNLIERGSAKRRTGETLLNKQSSRSHSIFSITIHIKETTQEGEELIKSGKLNLVDLAGSEDISRSGAREGRAREAGEINKSLLTIGRVITALVEHLGHVPYRDSKLTRLLKDSLGGKTKTCIIATISPSVHSLEETLSTLDYAYRAKSIRNKPEANQKTLKSSFIKDLHMEIERLKQDVRAARDKNGVYLPRDRYLQEEAEKKVMTEKIYRMECEVEFKDKHMNELQEMHNFQQKTIADLRSKLEAAHSKIEDTEESLRDLQEKCRQANYTIKEKEFIISNMLQSEKSLVEQATALQSDLEIASEDIDGLFAKIDRKDNIESGNQNLVQTFKSKLLQHLEVLHKSVADSVSQQTQHLRSTEEQLQSFALTKDQATEEMKNRVDKLKTTYCSGIKGLQDLVNELDKKTLATFGGVNLTVNSQASAFNDLLESAVSEADAILIELQTALGKQEEKLSSYAQEQRERIKRTVESTRTVSKIIVDFFENLQKHASTLCQFVEETQTVHDKNLVDLKKSYEELVAYEEKQTLEKISEILASSRARKTELMCTAVHNLRETAADKAHDLQEGMVDMQKITSNAQDEWTLYMKQAEDNYVEDTSSVEAGQRSIEEILHDCTVKTTAVEIQWKSTQVSLQQKGQSNVEEVDSIVKRGTEANQVVLSDLTHTVSSAHKEIENGMGGLLSEINESLKLDCDACQSIQPTIAYCTNDLVELQNNHNNKVEEITKDTDKYLVGEYLEDQPTCTTPKRRSICVPSVDSIEKLQTPCFEELVQAFEDAKSERRLKYGNGEVKQLYASPDVTPVRDARIPLTTLN